MKKPTPKPTPKPSSKVGRRMPGEITPSLRKKLDSMSPLDRKRYMAMIKGEKTAGQRSKNTI